MRNMSNTFYNYLSEKIVKYFQLNKPGAGEKYYVQFENDEQVRELYSELEKNTVSRKFLYEDKERQQRYETYELDFGTVQLVIAAAMEGGPHPDFLATLRNLVGMEEGYRDKAILFIHYSSLDSILGGAGNLTKEGLPLDISEIEKDIERRINETGYTEIDKNILKQYLRNKEKELDGTTASLFEYEDIIGCLNESQLVKDDYKKFELFPDDELALFTGKKLRERLEENHLNYVKVSENHSYGIDESTLEKTYGEDGAKALAKPDWQNITFSEVEKYITGKKNKSGIEYLPIISNHKIWDREEGSTKAKSRIRNIIIFVEDKEDEVEFWLNFSDFTKRTCINFSDTCTSFLKCTNTGKRLQVKITNIDDETVFCRLGYMEKGIKFDFKIAVLRCKPKLLEGIKTQYSIEIKRKNAAAIRINTEEDDIIFNEYAENKKEIEIREKNQCVQIVSDDMLHLTVNEDYPYDEENDDVHFVLRSDNFVIPMLKTFSVERPVVIEGIKLWYLKWVKKCSFEIQGDNNLVFGTKKYFAREEFRESLQLEKKYIEKGCPFAVEKTASADELEEVDMKLPEKVRRAFDEIIDYFKRHRAIPTLVYIDEEIQRLYENYLSEIEAVMESISEGTYLSEAEKGLFYLGMVKREYGDHEILLSPLHPINIAYQLFIKQQNMEGLEDEGYDLLRKFQQTSLLPYINIDPYTKETKIYIPSEQMDSPEWKVYVEESLPRYKGSKDFVSKLVSKTIREFVEHFSYLFSAEARTPVRINLVNTGDCREIVQGIIKYYEHVLNTTKSKLVMPIQVTMYSETKLDNAFVLISRIEETVTLENALGIKAGTGDISMEEIMDVYRKNVQFYVKNMDDEFEYAHVTFMELEDDHQAVSTVMDDIPSGVVMNGIASGIPSEMLGDAYRTGFGTKYANSNSRLQKIAVKYNAINAAMNGEAYRAGAGYAVKMSLNKQKVLDRLYDSSNWVTFIDPKVDLDYFKSTPESKDLMIIHYSDQYNMALSGYDAITVTRKSDQYKNAIGRYLKENGVEEVEKHSKKIINMFNALNGDWLLRMLSYKSHFPAEKLSVLSAMKLAVKRYSMEGIIWVPISLEEILRVSGAVGLSQKGSCFSAKNLGFEGQTSDDLLLIGIRETEKVQVTFYPIEVKIGKIESDYLEKGINQALNTRQIFETILGKGECLDKDIKTRLHRNFFMQQLIVNAGKMILYEVGDGLQMWDRVTKSDLRRKLLNEEYEIVDSLIPQMGKAGVISFREECVKEREFRNRDVMIIESTKKEGVNLLAKRFDEIREVEWAAVHDTQESDVITADGEEMSVDSEEIVSNKESFETEQYDSENESQEDERTKEETIRILIGEDCYKRKVFWEFGDKALANRHLLITGTSGQGKTYSIQTMLYELAKKNVSALIFDYTEGFTLPQLDDAFKALLGEKLRQYIVYNLGVSINPFERHEMDLAGIKVQEKAADVAARLADIFVHVYSFGAQQYSALFDAALNGMQKYGDRMDMNLFKKELELAAEHNKAAASALAKMSPFFHTVEFKNNHNFDWGSILYGEDAKVNIIQLTGFSREMQVVITEMMLWDAWYYTKKHGSKDKPFVVVLDEAQNLSHTMKSPSAAILTEGRKFGWSAWFATQSLKVLKDDEVVRMLQAAFKLYFKPTDAEVVRISKQLDATGETNWITELQKLKKGQCIVVGDRMKANGTVGPSAPIVTNITAFSERGGIR